MTIDFGMIPPEINSGRMYVGLGSGPLLAAAAAWDGLATELHSVAAAYWSVISGLTVQWQGAASAAMVAAAAPFAVWVSTSADRAEQTADQARTAATAYETAFAATVPPVAVTANRLQLSALVATNYFGQNTPLIMATQADYAEMWAQDAAAMYSYAGSSAAATQLTPFNPPPRTTSPAWTAGQGADVGSGAGAAAARIPMLQQLISAVPMTLRSLAEPASSVPGAASDPSAPASLASSLNTILGYATGPASPLSYFTVAGVPQLLGAQSYLLPQAGANLSAAAERAAVPSALTISAGQVRPFGAASAISAGAGRAGFIGGLSVPQGWAMSAPAIKSAAALVPPAVPVGAEVSTPPGEGPLFGSMALSGLAGRAMVSSDAGGGSAQATAGSVGESSGPVNIFIVPNGMK